MKEIREYFSAEIDVKRSRFLAELFPVSTQEEARTLLKSQKDKYFDATHVVHAFVLGSTGGILGCSDDGEPSGTAGKPVLNVLKGSDVTGAMLTVTRWFGGTLLGTGGLVKAYGDSAKAVISVAKLFEIIPMTKFSVSMPYDLFEKIKRDLPVFEVVISSEDFGSAVDLQGMIPDSRADEFVRRVNDQSSGRVRVVLHDDSPEISS
ncbi:MAG TPA: YigZ family protein [Spirochaetota bacterium]|nr:YigZ family protein [Spirochaetota bacterium]